MKKKDDLQKLFEETGEWEEVKSGAKRMKKEESEKAQKNAARLGKRI